MVLQAAIEQFLNFVKFEKKQSLHTWKASKTDLMQLSGFVLQQYNLSTLEALGHIHIRSWVARLMQEKQNARSISRKISTLKSFYRYLLRHELVSINPMDRVILPKTTRKLPVFVEEAAMEQLLDEHLKTEETPEGGSAFRKIKEHLILQLLYGTGMRRSELLGLTLQDINLYKLQIKVLGKRNKERLIPITAELAQNLEQYMRQKEAEGEAGPWLFEGKAGAQMNVSAVYKLVKTELAKVSTLQKRSPHVLRHTYATHLLNNGADLNGIKELLGHASLAATQVYTHNSIERLKEVYKNKHPRS